MPYRRLPNTDQARIRALRKAIECGQNISILNLAFSQSFYHQASRFCGNFEMITKQQKDALHFQNQNSKQYTESAQKARLYVSHFIQVFNFGVLRGEIKAEDRELYGLKIDLTSLPNLRSDHKLYEWGQKYIRGEQLRTAKGGNPIYSPSIAVVKAKYDVFAERYTEHNLIRKNTERLTKQVVELRKQADHLILNIWNEVEAYYSRFPASKRRDHCADYGLVYVYRPAEKKRLENQTSLEFEAQ